MQAHTHASSQPFQCSSVETFAGAPVAYELALLCQSTVHLTSSREGRSRLYLGQTGLPGHTDGTSAAFAATRRGSTLRRLAQLPAIQTQLSSVEASAKKSTGLGFRVR